MRSGFDYIVATENQYTHQLPHLQSFFDEYSNEESRYVNTGFQIATYEALIRIYRYLIENIEKFRFENANDQGVIGQFFVEQVRVEPIPGLKIAMDHGRHFVHTLNSRTVFIPENIRSYFIHVTWLYNPQQMEKFKTVVNHYGIR